MRYFAETDLAKLANRLDERMKQTREKAAYKIQITKERIKICEEQSLSPHKDETPENKSPVKLTYGAKKGKFVIKANAGNTHDTWLEKIAEKRAENMLNYGSVEFQRNYY